MMKLTEDLFADEQHAKYADFYEKAMVNHILSTQNPHTGGMCTSRACVRSTTGCILR